MPKDFLQKVPRSSHRKYSYRGPQSLFLEDLGKGFSQMNLRRSSRKRPGKDLMNDLEEPNRLFL